MCPLNLAFCRSMPYLGRYALDIVANEIRTKLGTMGRLGMECRCEGRVTAMATWSLGSIRHALAFLRRHGMSTLISSMLCSLAHPFLRWLDLSCI